MMMPAEGAGPSSSGSFDVLENVPIAKQVMLRGNERDEEGVVGGGVTSTSFIGNIGACTMPVPAVLLAPRDTSERLRVAAATNDVSTVRLILEAWGGNSEVVNEPDEHGKTAVWFAANYGHLRPLELLILYGADVTEANNGGIGPLYVAALGKHWGCYELLERQDASIRPGWMAIFKPCKSCLPLSAAMCCPCLVLHTICHSFVRASDSSRTRSRYARPVQCDATGVAAGELYC